MGYLSTTFFGTVTGGIFYYIYYIYSCQHSKSDYPLDDVRTSMREAEEKVSFYLTKVFTLLGLRNELLKCDVIRWLILSYHGQKSRYYHTLVHLREMLDLYEKHENSIRDHTCVLLAIFFHDIIYDAKSTTNEEDSAQMFRRLAIDAGINAMLVEKVCRYIIETKKHDVSQSKDR